MDIAVMRFDIKMAGAGRDEVHKEDCTTAFEEGGGCCCIHSQTIRSARTCMYLVPVKLSITTQLKYY